MGAAPSRQNTYTTGEIIEAADVTANEDVIFDYLQAGVDTYADDSIGASALDLGTGTDQISQDDIVDGAIFKQYNPASVAITGGSVVGITDLAVEDGGTGVGTLADGFVLLGSGTAAITPLDVTTDGAIVVGDGSTDPTTLNAFTSSTGTLKHESGGVEADVSGFGGIIGIKTGVTLDIDTSAEVAAAIGDETGNTLMVFNTSPTLVTPTLGVASATSLNASGTVTGLVVDTATIDTAGGIVTVNDNLVVNGTISGDDGTFHEAVTVTDTTTIDLTISTQALTADGLYTAGDNLTLTNADFDLDASISLTNVTASDTVTALVVDTQFLENSSGGAVTVRDDLDVMGDVTVVNITASNIVSGVLIISKGDTLYHGVSFIIDGMAEDRQDIFLTTDSGNVFFEMEKIGGGDVEYIFDESEFDLDCTTGAGAGGRAQVQLTEGTSTTISRNFIFVSLVGGVATLQASTSLPSAEFAWVALVGILTDTEVDADGALVIQRFSETLKHDESTGFDRGALSYQREKLRWLGASYINDGGIAQTLTITVQGASSDNVVLTTALGKVFQLHRQDWPAYDISTDGIWVANASGSGVLTNYQKLTDLNEAFETTDGTTISNNNRFNLVIWGSINFSTGDCKLFVNLPTGVYNDNDQAINDVNNTAVTTIPGEFETTGFLIARLPLRFRSVSSGTWTNLMGGTSVVDLRGVPPGFNLGSGATVGASATFSDDDFEVFDGTDSSKRMMFQVSGISDSTTRTFTLPDTSSSLLVSDGTQDLTSNWTIATNNITLTSGDLQAENLTADSTTSTQTVISDTYQSGDGSTGATATTGGAIFRDGLYITGEITGTGQPDQNLWETVAGDSGSTTASSPTQTLTIAGGTNATTAMSGDTLTVNVDDPPTFSGTTNVASIDASGTVTGVVVDSQYFEYSSGGGITVRDNLIVNGEIKSSTIEDSFSATLAFPDSLQSEIDNWLLKPIEATEFPNGITVTKLWLKTSASSSYTLVVEDWTDPTTASADIGTVATSTSTEASTEVSYSVSAGNIIMMDLPTTDIGWIALQVDYLKN